MAQRTMNDKGQAYFGASDKEIPQEDVKRLKETLKELENERFRTGWSEDGERFHCSLLRHREYKEPWIPERADLEEIKDEIDQALHTREQEKE